MTRPPTGEQLAGLLAEAHEILDQLAGGINAGPGRSTPNLAELLRRDALARRDGYPNTSINTGAASSGDTDRIGGLVAANLEGNDPIHRHAQTTLRGLTGAVGDLRMARDALAKAFQPEDLRPAEPGCVNHARLGLWEPVHQAGRCRWCCDFWRAEGVDAPDVLLQARAEGRRITVPMVRDALGKRGNRRRSQAGRT